MRLPKCLSVKTWIEKNKLLQRKEGILNPSENEFPTKRLFPMPYFWFNAQNWVFYRLPHFCFLLAGLSQKEKKKKKNLFTLQTRYINRLQHPRGRYTPVRSTYLILLIAPPSMQKRREPLGPTISGELASESSDNWPPIQNLTSYSNYLLRIDKSDLHSTINGPGWAITFSILFCLRSCSYRIHIVFAQNALVSYL